MKEEKKVKEEMNMGTTMGTTMDMGTMPQMPQMSQSYMMGQMPQMAQPYMMGQMPQVCCPFLMNAQCPMMYNQGMAGMPNNYMTSPFMGNSNMDTSMMGMPY